MSENTAAKAAAKIDEVVITFITALLVDGLVALVIALLVRVSDASGLAFWQLWALASGMTVFLRWCVTGRL